MKLLFHKPLKCLDMHFLNVGGFCENFFLLKIKQCKCPGTEKRTWEKRINQGGKIDCACPNFESVIWAFGMRIKQQSVLIE